MAIERIARKELGDITYELVLYPGNGKYAILKWDYNINGEPNVAHITPRVGEFSDEGSAKDYFDSLAS